MSKPRPKVFTDAQDRAFEQLHADTKALAESRLVQTQEAKHLFVALLRLEEIIIHGEPQTPWPERHHA